MGCQWCGKEVLDINMRAGRPKKYCSKKCSNSFYSERNKKKHPRYNDPTWKKETKLQKERDKKKYQENFARFEWLSENWYSYNKLSSITGKSIETCRQIAYNLKLQREQITVNLDDCIKTFTFLSPENAEKVINYQPNTGKGEYPPIPNGFLSREEVINELRKAGLGVTSHQNSFTIAEWQKSDKASKRALYSKKEVIKFINDVIKEREERQRLREEKREKKEKNKIFRKQQRELKRKEKILRKEQEREERAGLFREQNKCRVCGNGIDYKYRIWWSAPVYCSESCRKSTTRLPDDIKKGELAETEDLYLANTKRGARAVKVNEEYERLRRCGVITKIRCKDCNVEKAYDDFYRDLTVKRGRQSTCKQCKADKNKQAYDPVLAREKYVANPVGRMRTMVVTSIKKNIGRYTGGAIQLRIPKAWEFIEKNLGYTAEDLVEHIESQFDERMNWENWGQLGESEEFKWQIDHIIPQSHYKYVSLEDPMFAECWKLENLRPLCALENAKKGNKTKKEQQCSKYFNKMMD